MKKVISVFMVLIMVMISTVNVSATSSHSTLSLGSTGSEVALLQQMLNAEDEANLDVDSIFGNATYSAVKRFQTRMGLASDGIVGPLTWTKLEESYRAKSSTLAIGGGTYNPVSLKVGDAYSISGVISSNRKVTHVSVGVYLGTIPIMYKSVNPNSYSYNINALDEYIKFGSLASGMTYKFKVIAKDESGARKTLVSNSFEVKSRHTPSTHPTVRKFEETAISSWSPPLRTSYLNVKNGREFAASRDGGTRNHAAIDLYVPNGNGTPVYAVQDGKITNIYSNFYYGTQAVCVTNSDGSSVLYGEISPAKRIGDKVKKGECIGYIAPNQLDYGTMLHLEVYLGSSEGSLINYTNSIYTYVSGSYERRCDLIDPSFVLSIR